VRPPSALNVVMRPATPPAGEVKLCAFYVGSMELAIDIMRIDEILQPVEAQPFPDSPSHVTGMVGLRGTVVPVVDLRARLKAGPPRKGLKPKLVVAMVGRRRLALLVDGISEVLRVSRNDLKPSPMPHGGLVIGVVGPSDRMKLLLNLKALLRPGEGG
jgi:purine-binding chemotaxis protein CheW